MIKKIAIEGSKVRAILLIITITIFAFIATIFFININYFTATQARISKLIELTNYKDVRHFDAFSEFLETVNSFRNYSVNLESKYYNDYITHLNTLDTKIDKIINIHREDTTQTPLDPSTVISFNRYLLIDSKIQEIKNLIQTKDSATISHEQSKELFQSDNIKKSDEVYVDELYNEDYNDIDDTITLKTYNQELRNFSKLNSKRYNAFKNSYEILRNSDNKILTQHFTLLYNIYQILFEIDELQRLKQKNQLHQEHNELLDQSKKIFWQVLSCLIFIFVLILIMIYYQYKNKRVEKKLIDNQQYIAKLATEKSDILAEISHEIRTPINSLIGIIDLLRKRPSIYSQKEQLFLDTAYSNITNTSRTINDILNLSKIDYTAKIQPTEFDIKELALDIYSIHKSQADLKEINLELFIDEKSPTLIYSDELLLRQILTNLISNAIKYTLKGKVSCHISILDLVYLQIKIADTGVGIPDDIQPNIFKKYFTKPNEEKTNHGIGLGLYITKRLVKQLKGKISFTSKIHVGTKFTVEIPIPKAKFKHNFNSEFKTLADLPHNINWLLVDDNALNILYLKQFFQSFNDVKTASNGLEALEILKDFTPDVIITDINMPIMTGDELLVQIKQNPVLSNTKVIATSSDYEQIKELEVKQNTNFDNVIIKPFNEKDLVKVISQTIFSNLDH